MEELASSQLTSHKQVGALWGAVLHLGAVAAQTYLILFESKSSRLAFKFSSSLTPYSSAGPGNRLSP